MILMFFVTSFISIPQSVQDMVIHMCTTAVSGYTALLHVRLYRIYPVLVVGPTLLLAAVVHFIVQSNKMKQKIEFARLFSNNSDAGEEAETKREELLDSHNFNKKVDPLVDYLLKPETFDWNLHQDNLPLHQQQVEAYEAPKHRNRRQSVAHGVQIASKAKQMLDDASSHEIHEDGDDDGNDMEFTLSDETDEKLSSFETEDGQFTDSNLSPLTKHSMDKFITRNTRSHPFTGNSSASISSLFSDLSEFLEISDEES
jgi:hypothetical protein